MIFECPPEQFHFDKASIANFVDLREKSLEWEVPRAKEAAILLVARGLIRVGDVNQADASTMPLQPSWPFRVMTDVVTVKDQLEERVIELLHPIQHFSQRVRNRPPRARGGVHRFKAKRDIFRRGIGHNSGQCFLKELAAMFASVPSTPT